MRHAIARSRVGVEPMARSSEPVEPRVAGASRFRESTCSGRRSRSHTARMANREHGCDGARHDSLGGRLGRADGSGQGAAIDVFHTNIRTLSI